MISNALAATTALLLGLQPAGDGWLNVLKDAARQQRDQAIEEGTDAAADAAKETARGTVSGGKKKAKKQPAAEPAEDETSAEEAAQAPVPAKKGGKAAAAPAGEDAGAVYGNDFDFVPGDKVLFFDDFAETDVGDYPARWSIKDGGGAPADVVEAKGRRLFRCTQPKGDERKESMHWIRLDLKDKDLPQKFTVELDADLAGGYCLVFNDLQRYSGKEICIHGDGEIRSENARQQEERFGPGLRHLAFSFNGTYAKVYVGGKRVLVDSDAIERPITRVGIFFSPTWASEDDEIELQRKHLLVTSFRLAEGGKDYAKELTKVGRIVTHGITFDTGSDIIKPESGPALRGIRELLEKQAGLQFEIGGHTDDQGSAKVNGPLSERRAAAVKAWLVGQGIDGKRLTVKGYGDTKPIEPNATPEGRAMNRRVEFVKLGNS